MRHEQRRAWLAIVVVALSCHSDAKLPQGTAPTRYFAATVSDRHFLVADHMQASVEMQISGEPFATLLGYQLTQFNRFSKQTDLYVDPKTGELRIDPLGYAAAIESYEYSKQPMNNVSFESGAGMSLQFAPLLNPTGATGDAAYQLLVDRLQHFADESYSGGPPGRNFVVSPAPTDNPLNSYGWPGYWPVFAPYRSFDSMITPSAGTTTMRACTFVGGYQASSMGATRVGAYECGYNSLNLPLRDNQVEKVLEPAALGFTVWKQALWAINYWQTLHDTGGNGITVVADADIPQVGVLGNTIVGKYPDPTDPTGQKLLDGATGVYLGDITLEGWQGLTLIEEMDNQSSFLLQRSMLSESALTRIGGFASTKDAIAYDYASPIAFWPAAVAVTETATTTDPMQVDKYFPQPTAFKVTDATSRLRDLTALAGGYGEFFALTDFGNAAIGGLPSSRATFDGDPFAADDQLPDGEESPHDRALAVLKIALVDLDRLHWDDTHKVLVDTAAVSGPGQVTRGTRVTTHEAAYAIVALRIALHALTHQLTLYANDTPDTVGAATVLDGASWQQAPWSGGLSRHLTDLLRAEGDFLATQLVHDDGSVVNFMDLSTGADAQPATLAAAASAIRGLLEAYLATSDDKYRQRAILVYGWLESHFWMPDVRAFRTTDGVSDKLTYNPVNFGALSGALRQYWKLVARRPGSERTAAELLERWKRLNKLVANGWDDANADDRVQYPDECTGAGLQMAERALTGELGNVAADGADRDHDCVPEISTANRPAALAAELVITRKSQP